MAVVEALLGEAKGVFGKAYLLAGLLPAGLLLFSASWYLWGLGGMQSRLFSAPAAQSAGKEKGEKGPDRGGGVTVVALGAGVVLVVTSLVFFAARGPLLLLFRELPGDGFRPLNRSLRSKQLRRLRELLDEERQLRWAHSALVWHKRDFTAYPYVEPWVRPPRLADAIRSSERARAELKACAPDYAETGRLPALDRMQPIEDGLRRLRETTASRGEPEWKYEAAAWSIATRNELLSRLLDDIADDRYRAWAEVKRQIDAFPQERWVRPTALGNRFGAIEEYSATRYKVDMYAIWTRMVGVLSDAQRKEVEDAELSVEVMINLAAAGALFCALVLSNSLSRSWRAASAHAWVFDWLSAAGFAGGLVMALVAYRGAVFAVGSLRDKVIRLFDLNHVKLTEALGFETPKTFGKQLLLLKELNDFFMRSGKVSESWALKQPSAPAKKDGGGEGGSGAGRAPRQNEHAGDAASNSQPPSHV